MRLSRAVQVFADEAGKEPAARRERLRILISFAIEFYRYRLRDEARSELVKSVDALDSCLMALEHIDRNANLGLVIQNWCEELAGKASRLSAAAN